MVDRLLPLKPQDIYPQKVNFTLSDWKAWRELDQTEAVILALWRKRQALLDTASEESDPDRALAFVHRAHGITEALQAIDREVRETTITEAE